jgi:hypothetical protein
MMQMRTAWVRMLGHPHISEIIALFHMLHYIYRHDVRF